MKSSIFEKIIQDIGNNDQGSALLDEVMQFNADTTKNIPIRYRILALGFVNKMTHEEVNEKLLQAGCPQLYARSYWEASLIYAYTHQLSFKEWKELEENCSVAYEKITSDHFQSNSITIGELQKYLDENSDEEQASYATMHMTRSLEAAIAQLNNDDEFFKYITANINMFSMVREKTRFYFCKYLYLYLKGVIERYIENTGDEFGTEEDMDDIVVIKGITKLKRKKYSAEEKREFLYNQAISPKEIFDAFNYYFFEYVSQDWLEVLLDYYGNIESLPENQKVQLAKALRHYDTSLEGKSDDEVIEAQLEKMEKEEEELDEIYSLDSENRGYQRNRGGENTIRKMIKGNVDIDRTSLICFLIFFGSNTELSERNQINVKRLSTILHECGFNKLNEKDEYDKFIIEYLESDEPEDFLMEEVTRYAIQEQNFFLYQMYRGAVSYDEEFKKIIG